MKRIEWLVAGLGVAGLLAVAPVARAGEKSATQDPTAQTFPDAAYMNDVVQKYDKSSNQITLANSGKTMQVSENCKVMMNGKSASMSDIKEGSSIRAAMTGSGDSAKIVEIWVLPQGSEQTGTGSADQNTGSSEQGTGSTDQETK